MLDVEIPRLHVSILEFLIDALRRKPCRTSNVDRVIQANISAECKWYPKRRIAGCRCDDARHRLIDVNTVSGPDHCLVATRWLPCKAGARLKSPLAMVNLIEAGSDATQRSCLRIEDDKTVVAFGRRHVPVVTKGEVER